MSEPPSPHPEELDVSSLYPKENLPETSVMIATPCFGGLVHTEYALSLISSIKTLESFDIKYSIRMITNESLVTRARNHLVSYFMAGPCSHMIFIDADIVFPAESIVRLIAANKGVACGAYPLKTSPEQEDFKRANKYVVNMSDLALVNDLSETQKVFTVADAGTGFMMIRREVFEIMKTEHPELKYTSDYDRGLFKKSPSPDVEKGLRDNLYSFFDTMHDLDNDNAYLSEDYAFCKRWSKIGGKIWVDPDIKLDHIGKYTYRGDTSELNNLIN